MKTYLKLSSGNTLGDFGIQVSKYFKAAQSDEWAQERKKSKQMKEIPHNLYTYVEIKRLAYTSSRQRHINPSEMFQTI